MDMDTNLTSLTNLAYLDESYHTDSILTPSSVESEEKDEYTPEVCLSEEINDEGKTLYLIKWLDYDFYRCTWEPAEHLRGTPILPAWRRLRIEQGEARFSKIVADNKAKWEESQKKAEANRLRRKVKRAKKRSKMQTEMKRRVSVIVDDSDSSDDIPIMASRKKPTPASQRRPTKDNSKPSVPENSKQRKLPSEHSSSEVETDATVDSLQEELMEEAKRKEKAALRRQPPRAALLPDMKKKEKKKKKPTKPTSTDPTRMPKQIATPRLEQPSKLFADPSARTTSSDRPANGPTQKTRPAADPVASRAPAQPTGSNARRTSTAAKVLASGALLAPNTSNPMTSIGKEVSGNEDPGPIRLVNQPKGATKEWRNSDGPYKTLHFRAVAEKRSKREGTPDLTSLEFVNGDPYKSLSRNTTESIPQAPPNENLYGRHEPSRCRSEQEQREELHESPPAPPNRTGPIPQPPSDEILYGRREPSRRRSEQEQQEELHESPPAPPNRTRPIPQPPSNEILYGRRELPRRCSQQEDANETPPMPSVTTATEATTTAVPAVTTQAPEVPSEFLHAHEAGKAPLICFDWRNRQCRFAAAQCRFLHRDEDPSGRAYKLAPWDGFVPPKYASPPVTCYFWLREPKGCLKPAHDCKFAHYNTGLLASKDCKRSEKINPAERPTLPLPRLRRDQLTCHFWAHGNCNKTDYDCPYQHFDTGVIADPPPNFKPKDGWKPPPLRQGLGQNAVYATIPATLQSRLPDSAPFTADGVISGPTPGVGADGASRSRVIPDGEVTSTPLHQESQVPRPLPSPKLPAAKLSCEELKLRIEHTYKLDFAEMFTDIRHGSILDRRAFLLLDPEEHLHHLELITRWLLMHHVEVYSFWCDGAWGSFQKGIAEGKTGVIITHPDFERYSEIPGFGNILQTKVMIWEVAVPTSPPSDQYDRFHIFPMGGFIYITDEVFQEKPVEALKIVELFFEKIEKCRQVEGAALAPWQRVSDGCVLWRLCVRPELMQSIWDKCEEHQAEIEAGDPVHNSRLRLYDLLQRSGYIEGDDATTYILRDDDHFPIISERRVVLDDWYYPALEQSQAEANTRMIEYFCAMATDQKMWYRQYFVVHTDLQKAKQWKQMFSNISEVMTPETCIWHLGRPGKFNKFDFYEWMFPLKERPPTSDFRF